jgi:hypothetical protein
MSYEKCVVSVGTTLKKRGIDNHEELASSMCNTWADENGVEREFGRTLVEGDKRRTFALSLGESEDISFTEEEGVEAVTFPVIAITSGPHEYEEDDIQQKVYIEPEVLRKDIESFKELPIYLNHQRTSDDLIGMAANPEVFEMDNGMTAIKMLAKVDNKTESGKEVLEKVKEGDMTHVSIDWFSNDVDVMGDTFATNIRPTEVSFIDNKTMDPVCKECTIENDNETCDLQAKDDDHDCGCGGHEGACECSDGKQEVINMTEETPVKSEAENIVEREFASLRSQLEEVEASNAEIKSQYEEALKTIETFKLAEEERAAKEAEARKVETVEAIISKEILFNTIDEDKKDARVEELSAWDEPRLTGFSEALAAMPVPEETERTFGKGKSNEGEELSPTETERQFAVKMDEKTGRFKLNPEVLRGN